MTGLTSCRTFAGHGRIQLVVAVGVLLSACHQGAKVTEPNGPDGSVSLAAVPGDWQRVDSVYSCVPFSRRVYAGCDTTTVATTGIALDSAYFAHVWDVFRKKWRLDSVELILNDSDGRASDSTVQLSCSGYMFDPAYEICKSRAHITTAGVGDSTSWEIRNRVEYWFTGSDCSVPPGDTLYFCVTVKQDWARLPGSGDQVP